MTTPAELAVLALRQVSTLLGKLTAEQLAELGDGRGQLVFRSGGAEVAATGRAARPRAAVAGPGVDVDATVAAVTALGSREEVEDYLTSQGRALTVLLLKQVAQRLGPTVATASKKADLIRNIAEGTAGFRERSAAMSGGAWG